MLDVALRAVAKRDLQRLLALRIGRRVRIFSAVAVLRHAALLADDVGVDPHERAFGESGERIVGLVGADVAVGQEQDARPAGGLGLTLPVGEVSAALEQLPGELEGDEGLAGAGRKDQQDAVLPRYNALRQRRMAMSW